MRIFRWLFSLAMFAVIIWFATSVKLGGKTLWQHVKAIAGTREAHDLAEGTKEEARKVADRLRDGKPDGGAPDLAERPLPRAPKGAAPPLDPVEESDRRDLDQLVRTKTGAKAPKPRRDKHP